MRYRDANSSSSRSLRIPLVQDAIAKAKEYFKKQYNFETDSK